jgi:hypothetical protein
MKEQLDSYSILYPEDEMKTELHETISSNPRLTASKQL